MLCVLWCGAACAQVEVMRCMMDLDGDGQVTLPELIAAIKEAYAARTCLLRACTRFDAASTCVRVCTNAAARKVVLCATYCSTPALQPVL